MRPRASCAGSARRPRARSRGPSKSCSHDVLVEAARVRTCSGMAEEELEERVLARAEREALAGARRDAARRVELDVGVAQDGPGAAAAPQQRAQPREHLGERARLHHVVVGARVEARDAVVDAVAPGEHEHRQRRAAGAEARAGGRARCGRGARGRGRPRRPRPCAAGARPRGRRGRARRSSPSRGSRARARWRSGRRPRRSGSSRGAPRGPSRGDARGGPDPTGSGACAPPHQRVRR